MLKDIFDNHGLSGQMFQNVKKRMSKKGGETSVWLTGLQEKVLKDDRFWKIPGGNMIIQGATSSGKTLLGEIAALFYLEKINMEAEERRKVVFLVPLKALVSDRLSILEKDFRGVEIEGHKIDIFASSSDYQEHDEQILQGSFDIAVIVYEKFFAMLSQKESFRDRCGLVIVDELQMLASYGRGPKLEFSIMQLRNTSVRMMALVTKDCKVKELADWINAEEFSCETRPVGLNEIVLNYKTGAWKGEYTSGERYDSRNNFPNKDNLPMELDPRFEDSSVHAKDEMLKQKCLLSLLQKTLNAEIQNTETKIICKTAKKILIFANSKQRTMRLAEIIRRKLGFLQEEDLDNEREEALRKLKRLLEPHREEADIPELLDQLIPCGIAIHHSSLPTMVREAVEEDFREENGCIRIIICTETLMVGVNLPADVVILYDKSVYRGEQKAVRLSGQEYKNYIGRAGRLGVVEEGQDGYSYLLTDNLKEFETYVRLEPEEIVSAFSYGMAGIGNGDDPAVLKEKTKIIARKLAPYYMNLLLLEKNPFEKMVLTKKISGSMFFYKSCENEKGVIAALGDNILEILEKPCGLLKRETTPWGDDEYKLETDGRSFAPYAIALESSLAIQKYFKERGKTLREEELEIDDEGSGSQDRLLDLFYILCKTPDVAPNPALRDFGDSLEQRTNQRKLNDIIKTYLESAKKRKLLYDGSPLEQIIDEDQISSSQELCAALRAIVLRLWTKGETLGAIREKAGLKMLRISSGDISRIAEVCAYLIEAISMLVSGRNVNVSMRRAFYQLSIRVKYGVPRQLIPLANVHAHGVSRGMLLSIGSKARKQGISPEDVVIYEASEANGDSRYRELHDCLIRRREMDNYNQLINNISDGTPVSLAALFEDIRRLDERLDDPEWMNVLKNVLEGVPGRKEHHSSVVSLRGSCLSVAYEGAGIHDLYLMDTQEGWEEEALEILQEKHKGIFVLRRPVLRVPEKLRGENVLIITAKMLGILIAHAVVEGGDDASGLMNKMLGDLCGPMIHDSIPDFFFNRISRLYALVRDYARKEIQKKEREEDIYLLCFSGAWKMNESSLKKSSIRKEETKDQYHLNILPWGTQKGDGAFVAVIYHPGICSSRMALAILRRSQVVVCTQAQENEVKKLGYEGKIIYSTDGENILRNLICLSQNAGQEAEYEFKVGISYRGNYEAQISELYGALKKLLPKGEKICKMKEGDFPDRMASGDMSINLYNLFRKCHHIIICSTHDWDESYYTAVIEAKAIEDIYQEHIRKRQRTPVYRVVIPGVKRSQKCEVCFPGAFYDLADGTDQVAKKLLNAMEIQESNPQQYE